MAEEEEEGAAANPLVVVVADDARRRQLFDAVDVRGGRNARTMPMLGRTNVSRRSGDGGRMVCFVSLVQPHPIALIYDTTFYTSRRKTQRGFMCRNQ